MDVGRWLQVITPNKHLDIRNVEVSPYPSSQDQNWWCYLVSPLANGHQESYQVWCHDAWSCQVRWCSLWHMLSVRVLASYWHDDNWHGRHWRTWLCGAEGGAWSAGVCIASWWGEGWGWVMGLDVYDTRNLSQWLAANNDQLPQTLQTSWLARRRVSSENSWLWDRRILIQQRLQSFKHNQWPWHCNHIPLCLMKV